MPLMPVNIPPGVYKNGTRYQSKGRWFETDLCRWHNGALVPIGGWVRRSDDSGDPVDPIVDDPDIERVRDGYSWRSNDTSAVLAWGSNLNLTVMAESGVTSVITPAGLPPGLLDPPVYDGYGVGSYGTGTYGSPRTAGSLGTNPVARWKFDNWGENLLAMADWTGTIYQWEYGFPADLAEPLPNAPTGIVDFTVTDQRTVMTIGADHELRLVQWSDSENAEDWTPTTVNQAGSQVLAGHGRMVGCYNVQKQILILTETDAYAARYLGPPYVYGFDRVGTGCEPVHRSAIVTTDKFAIWIGRNHVWMYDGTLHTVPCDLMDFVLDDVANGTGSTVVGFTVADFTEVWWLYTSTGGAGNVDSYIMYDWTDGSWAHGRLARNAAVDREPADSVLMVDYEGRVWRHEMPDQQFEEDGYGPYQAYALTGPFEMGEGETNLAVRYIYPDTQTYGSVDFKFEGRVMPTDQDPITYGTYAYDNPISTTGLMGRELMMGVYATGVSWRYGSVRLDVAGQTGRR